MSLVCYYLDQRITEHEVRLLENTGSAHLAMGGSGGVPHCGDVYITDHDIYCEWMMFVPGPGNCWIETVEGTCTHCGCRANLHIKTQRGGPPWTLENYDWGTQCTCGCRVDIPHGDADDILRKARRGHS